MIQTTNHSFYHVRIVKLFGWSNHRSYHHIWSKPAQTNPLVLNVRTMHHVKKQQSWQRFFPQKWPVLWPVFLDEGFVGRNGWLDAWTGSCLIVLLRFHVSRLVDRLAEISEYHRRKGKSNNFTAEKRFFGRYLRSIPSHILGWVCSQELDQGHANCTTKKWVWNEWRWSDYPWCVAFRLGMAWFQDVAIWW